MKIPILEGIKTTESDYQTTYPTNLLVVPKETGTSDGYLNCTDGIQQVATLTGEPRGAIVNQRSGVQYRVHGEALYTVDGATTSSLGAIPGADFVPMAYGYDTIGFAADGVGYAYGNEVQERTLGIRVTENLADDIVVSKTKNAAASGTLTITGSVTRFEVLGQTYTPGAKASITSICTITVSVSGAYTITPSSNYLGNTPLIKVVTSTGDGLTIRAQWFDTPWIADDDETVLGAKNAVITGTVLRNAAASTGTVTVSGFDAGGSSYAPGATANITDVGTLVINSNGTFTFTPVTDYVGAFSATYTATNGSINKASTLTLSSYAPTSDDINVTVAEDVVASGNAITGVPGALSVSGYTVSSTFHEAGTNAEVASIGTFTVASNGDWTFTPDPGFSGLVPTVTFSVEFGETLQSGLYLKDDDTITYSPIDVVWVNQFYFWTDGELILQSTLPNPLAVQGFADAEQSPDLITGLVATRDELIVCGKTTIERFRNVGAGTFTFRAVPGGVLDKGVVSPSAKVRFSNTFAFVGGGQEEDLSVWIYGGANAQKIATRDIEREINAVADVTKIVMDYYTTGAHQFIICRLPSGASLVYDVSTQEWHRRTWDCQNIVSHKGKWCVGGSGKIGTLGGGSEWGSLVRREFGTKFIPSPVAARIYSLEMKGNWGRYDEGENPQAEVETSFDGIDWSQPRIYSLGQRAFYDFRPKWRNIGFIRGGRQFAMRFAIESTGVYQIAALEINE